MNIFTNQNKEEIIINAITMKRKPIMAYRYVFTKPLLTIYHPTMLVKQLEEYLKKQIPKYFS